MHLSHLYVIVKPKIFFLLLDEIRMWNLNVVSSFKHWESVKKILQAWCCFSSLCSLIRSRFQTTVRFFRVNKTNCADIKRYCADIKEIVQKSDTQRERCCCVSSLCSFIRILGVIQDHWSHCSPQEAGFFGVSKSLSLNLSLYRICRYFIVLRCALS